MSSILDDEWTIVFRKMLQPRFLQQSIFDRLLNTFISYFRHICRHLNEDIRTHYYYKRSYDKLKKIGPEKNH